MALASRNTAKAAGAPSSSSKAALDGRRVQRRPTFRSNTRIISATSNPVCHLNDTSLCHDTTSTFLTSPAAETLSSTARPIKMPTGPVPSLDALVIKLLEVSYAATVHVPQVKNLVAQLPAAAAEVRGIKAQSHGQNGPCTCGLHDEIVRLQKQLQVYIDEEPNTKKGNARKTMAMENQRLTKLAADQKKEINGHLTAMWKRDREIAELRHELKSARDDLAWSDKIRKEQRGSTSTNSVQTTGGFTGRATAQQATSAGSSMLASRLAASNSESQSRHQFYSHAPRC